MSSASVGLLWRKPDFTIQILSGGNKNGVEMHFECDFAPFRIQTLTQSHPRQCNIDIYFGVVLEGVGKGA